MDFFLSKIVTPEGAASVALLLWALLVYGEAISAHIKSLEVFGDDIADMEWRKGLAEHAAFYGAAIGVFFGGHGALGKVLSVVSSLALLWYSLRLKANIKKLEKIEKQEAGHRHAESSETDMKKKQE